MFSFVIFPMGSCPEFSRGCLGPNAPPPLGPHELGPHGVPLGPHGPCPCALLSAFVRQTLFCSPGPLWAGPLWAPVGPFGLGPFGPSGFLWAGPLRTSLGHDGKLPFPPYLTHSLLLPCSWRPPGKLLGIQGTVLERPAKTMILTEHSWGLQGRGLEVLVQAREAPGGVPG